MIFHIDPRSGLPIYRQLADQVKLAIARGTLRAGDQLSSVRAVSETLSLNPATVQKAWQELERQGVAENRRGLGMFIAQRSDGAGRAEARRAVGEAAARLAAEAIAFGLDEDDVISLLKKTMRSLGRNDGHE